MLRDPFPLREFCKFQSIWMESSNRWVSHICKVTAYYSIECNNWKNRITTTINSLYNRDSISRLDMHLVQNGFLVDCVCLFSSKCGMSWNRDVKATETFAWENLLKILIINGYWVCYYCCSFAKRKQSITMRHQSIADELWPNANWSHFNRNLYLYGIANSITTLLSVA